MFNSDNGYSLADIAAVTNGANGNSSHFYGNGNGGFFGDGSWIFLLFILFAFGGWGNGGWGFGNGFGGGYGNNVWANGALTRGELCQDMNFLGLTNNVEAVKTGVSDALFTVNTNLLQGFDNTTAAVANSTAALQNTLATGFANIALADTKNTDAIQLQMNNNAMNTQQSFCNTNNLLTTQMNAINYNLATEECATRTALASGLRDVIDASNNNTKQLLDFLIQDKLTTLQSENQALRLAASQERQNNVIGQMMDANTAEIIARTAPTPVPAYQVPNPYTGCCNNYGCGGCGCGQFG